MQYGSKQIENLLHGIYSGKISARKLPKDLYQAIAEHLLKGMAEGYGNGPLLKPFTENLYMFSAAKTFQQVLEMEGLTGLEFADYKEGAQRIFDLHNKTWLDVEYDSAIAQGQNAKLWEGFERNRENGPTLEYSAVMDDNTAEECAVMDGVRAPINSPVWDTNSPQQHPRCRCTLLQGDWEDNIPNDLPEVDEAMQNNPGKTGEIFSPKHPYFDVPSEYRALAEDNFNLPIPDGD